MNTRRLDALLARHLIGLDAVERMIVTRRVLDRDNRRVMAIYGEDSQPWPPSTEQAVRRWVTPGGPGDYREVDRYATTYAGMGAVIEAMRGRRYWPVIISWPDGSVTCDWRDAQLRVAGEAAGGTLPAAVALAAAWVVCPDELGELEGEAGRKEGQGCTTG